MRGVLDLGRVGRAAGSALLAVVLLTGLAALLLLRPAGQATFPQPSSSRGPTPSVASGRPTDPHGSGSPLVADAALTPIDIVAALAVRDGRVDDRELAVAGFLSDDPTLPCPFVPLDPNPAFIHCPESFQWLMENDEVLWHATANGSEGGPPRGPAFHPSFALVDPPERRNLPLEGVPPRPVVLVGHFDDRRASLCKPDQEAVAACADVFVVDRVAVISGVTLPIGTRFDNPKLGAPDGTVPPAEGATQVDALIAVQDPGGLVLSRQLLTNDALLAAEPELRGDPLAIRSGLFWLVTTLDLSEDGPVARTWLLVDGADTVRSLSG